MLCDVTDVFTGLSMYCLSCAFVCNDTADTIKAITILTLLLIYII